MNDLQSIRPPRRSLLLGLAFLSLHGCSKGGGGGENPVDASARLTGEATTSLFGGDDDFATLSKKLATAVQLDPGNEQAALFLGVVQTLDWLDTSATASNGRLRDLFTRSGFTGPATDGSSFWQFTLTPEAHGQGEVKDNAPRAAEVVQYLETDLVPRLEALVTVLEAAPADFRYIVPLSQFSLHPLASALPSGNAHDYELDHGDLRALAAGLNVVLAQVHFLLAYDYADADPNEFDPFNHPGVDPLLVIRDTYPNLGNVISTNHLAMCRTRLEQAWADYLAASSHIRNETPDQAARGILTLAPDVLISAAQRAQLLADEAAFRSWGAPVVAAFPSNIAYLFDHDPKGNPLPAEDQVAINFFRLFQGVNFRDVFFRIVNDPFRGQHRIGVTDLGQITGAMLSGDGVVASVASLVPVAGDLQADGHYAIRIDAPPTSTKVIDGDHLDWATGSVQIGGAPLVTIAPSTADLGDVFTARDSAQLYLRIDADLQTLLDASDYGVATIEVNWLQGSLSGSSWVQLYHLSPAFVYSPYGQPVVATSAAGVEVAVPAPPGTEQTWAKISVRVYAQAAANTLDNGRGDMLVRFR